MDRRTSLKNLVLATGTLIALPGWAEAWDISSLKNVPLTFASDHTMLAAVADTIIPAGNSIGALSVGVDKFLQKLLAQCYEKEVQDNVSMQLKSLDQKAITTHGKSFAACEQTQREALLNTLALSEEKNEKDFFELIKSETIRGFSTSREVMLNHLNYKILPGHYYGCVDVNA